MTAPENALAKILDKAAELQAQCESCCAQLNGTEVRLKTLLRTRHELLANPSEGVPVFPLDLIERSQEVRADLSVIQQGRIAIEEKIRHGLALRRRIQSELLSLDARHNERSLRFEELSRRVEAEFAEDPHREELQRHLEDLQHRRATASDTFVSPSSPPPAERRQPKKRSVFNRALAAIGIVDDGSSHPPRITPLPEPQSAVPGTDRATAEFDQMIARVVAQIQQLKASLREREGVSAVESQCQSLQEKRRELLETEQQNRVACQQLFEEWRMIEVLQGQERHKALRDLGLAVDAAVSSELGTAAPRGSAHQLRERLDELAEVVEACRLELERLVRNCDRTLIGLQRMMDLEARFWRSEMDSAPSDADFDLLLGDLLLEGRGASRSSGRPQAPEEASDSTDRPKFEQKKLWSEP